MQVLWRVSSTGKKYVTCLTLINKTHSVFEYNQVHSILQRTVFVQLKTSPWYYHLRTSYSPHHTSAMIVILVIIFLSCFFFNFVPHHIPAMDG